MSGIGNVQLFSFYSTAIIGVFESELHHVVSPGDYAGNNDLTILSAVGSSLWYTFPHVPIQFDPDRLSRSHSVRTPPCFGTSACSHPAHGLE